MIEKLEKIYRRFLQIEEELGKIDSPDKLKVLYKERAKLTPIYQKIEQYKNFKQNLEDAKDLILTESDSEMHKMLKDEIIQNEKEILQLERDLEILLLPKDPDSGKNILVEIRAGTGGEEAGLFVADLFRMYAKYCEKKGLNYEVIDSSPTGIGGFKEIIFSIEDEAGYDLFKFEAGTHRVQRIPSTESNGRIHTSAVTVAVLPEAEEKEVEIHDQDIRVDVFRSSGAGGQHVNTTDSAVRILHIPTGIIVSCQDEKSQIKNRAKALRILSARILEKKRSEEKAVSDAKKKQMIGSGDRSERIRTYNFPQGRCTDHRIGFTSHNLMSLIEGDMDPLIQALTDADRMKKMDEEKN